MERPWAQKWPGIWGLSRTLSGRTTLKSMSEFQECQVGLIPWTSLRILLSNVSTKTYFFINHKTFTVETKLSTNFHTQNDNITMFTDSYVSLVNKIRTACQASIECRGTIGVSPVVYFVRETSKVQMAIR